MAIARADGYIAPCIPTLAHKPLHEIKHDGYRRIVRRDGKAVRLFTASPSRANDLARSLEATVAIAG
jgi:ATP-dependent DNA ligase